MRLSANERRWVLGGRARIRDNEWGVFTMDDGRVAGPFATKREAYETLDRRLGGLDKIRRIEAGEYEITTSTDQQFANTHWVMRGQNARRNGFRTDGRND